jgi:hypothetical protein
VTRLRALAALSIACLAGPALATGPAPTFSIDFQGPSIALPDGFGPAVIDEGSILTPSPPGSPGPNPPVVGPAPPPGVEVGALAGAIGAVPGGLGILAGLLGRLELDALSYGRDVANPFGLGNRFFFSVDEWAAGHPLSGVAPNVATEGMLGALEASADVFRLLLPFVMAPPLPPGANTSHYDGNGLAPPGLGIRGFGLLEPNPPAPGVGDVGDNLDALDVDTFFADLTGPIFFSLDSAFLDPLEGFPANSGTAVGIGASGADVLVSFAGGAPVVAIPGTALGLDLFGADSDDLDALIFNDADGSATLTPGDTIYFSVRRGSAVIGFPDGLTGIPIEEGDVLTPPPGAGLPPALFVAAETLGLGTLRSGTAGPSGFGDDLDAMDVLPPATPVANWAIGALAALLPATALLAARLRRSGA